MGGRGKQVSERKRTDERVVFVDLSFNPDRPSRPWSIPKAEDKSRWHEDARGRVRTFSSEQAAREFAQSQASGPVAFRVFDKTGQHYD